MLQICPKRIFAFLKIVSNENLAIWRIREETGIFRNILSTRSILTGILKFEIFSLVSLFKVVFLENYWLDCDDPVLIQKPAIWTVRGMYGCPVLLFRNFHRNIVTSSQNFSAAFFDVRFLEDYWLDCCHIFIR